MTKRRVSGGSKLRRQLRRLEPALRADLARVMPEIGKDLAAEITANAPRDEGNLAAAAHYTASRDGLGVSIGYSQNQSGFKMKWRRGGFAALWQEFGTRHHAAQPFIRKAWRTKIKASLDKIDGALKASIARILEKT